MRRDRVVGLVLLFVVVAGCASDRIDGSSPEAMQQSLERLGQDLAEEEAEAFGAAVMLVALDGLSLAEMGSEDLEARTAAALDGLTVEEVIARAAEIESAREAAEAEQRLRAEEAAREQQALAEAAAREQLVRDIAELEARQTAADEAREVLSGFVVDSARFSLEPQPYGSRSQPMIELSVTNGMDVAVARAYFRGVVATPGRAVPWIEEEFNYSIPGGLEAGESATWTLAPNMFSDWGTVDVPDDAVMTATVVDLDGADGESVVGDVAFTERDAERLQQLRARLTE